MMIRLPISLLLLSVNSSTALSQYIGTVEAGKEFTIELSYGLGNVSYETFTLICDTLIDGNTYLTLMDDEQTIIGFLREDTILQEVYYVESGAQNEVTFYTYDKETGDTAIVNGVPQVIHEVRYEEHFGAVRKVLVVHDLLSLIEGAGTSRYGIVPSFDFPHPWPALVDLQYTDPDCEQVATAISSTTPSAINTFPNPFRQVVHLQNSGNNIHMDYALYNPDGNVVRNGSSSQSTTINTQSLPAGHYILVVNGETLRLVKQ